MSYIRQPTERRNNTCTLEERDEAGGRRTCPRTLLQSYPEPHAALPCAMQVHPGLRHELVRGVEGVGSSGRRVGLGGDVGELSGAACGKCSLVR